MNEIILNLKNRLENTFQIESIGFLRLLFIFTSFSLFITQWWLPRNWGFYGKNDWDLTYSTFEVVRKSIVEFSQFPHHNPYLSYGSDLWSNPQSVQFNLLLIPVLIFGTFYGLKLGILLFLIWSSFGTYKWFYSLKLSPFYSLMLTLSLISCSYFGRHIFEAGHSNFVYFYGLPWIFYWLISFQNSNKLKFLSFIILYLTLTLIGGAPMMFLIMLILVLIYLISFYNQKISSLIILSLIVILLPLMLGFFKLYPVLSNWSQFPRLVFDNSYVSFITFFQALGDFTTDSRTPHDWHEITLGFPLVLLSLILFFYKKLKFNLIFVICFFLILWFSMGNFPNKYNPWYFANHYLPIFNGLRSPYRFGIIIVFLIYFILAKSLKNENNIVVSYLLIFVAFSQVFSHNAISKLNVNSQRIEDLNKLYNKSEEINISKLCIVKPHQFLWLKNNYLVSNAYEPMVLSEIKDSLKNVVEGGEISYFSPNKIIIKTLGDTVKTSIRYSENLTNKNLSKSDNRIEIYNQNNQTITLDFSYKIPIISIIVSLFGLILLLVFFRK